MNARQTVILPGTMPPEEPLPIVPAIGVPDTPRLSSTITEGVRFLLFYGYDPNKDDDAATMPDEDTPMELLAQVRPDILVKGGDYDMAKLPETSLMASWGGIALALPFVAGYSTTALVRKIRG